MYARKAGNRQVRPQSRDAFFLYHSRCEQTEARPQNGRETCAAGTRTRCAASEQADVLRTEYLVLGRAFLQAAAGRRIPRAREPCGTDRRLQSQNRRIARGSVARSLYCAVCRAIVSSCEARTQSERLGLSSRGSQLEKEAESSGLGFHVGETRLPREGRPVPAASHFARRESRRQRRVLESSRSVGTQLSAASLVEYSLQPDRHHSLHFVYGQR